ncbi:MAG: HNH endonuclease, partial [Planctomycetes bacterium]|nr:HNH endonuclease [Planctomycetota bacterium]
SGVHTDGNDAGTLSWWVSACSSRCLFAGYRYEAPLAGIWDRSGITPVLTHRQAGRNFAGQYYTLHRHYDPVLMRFTSPDPIAAEFWNLNSYSGNSPGRFYDPDGLDPFAELKRWEDDAYYHSEDFDEDYFFSEEYEEDSVVRQYEKIGEMVGDPEDMAAGMTYGAANGASIGIYGAFVSPEDHNAMFFPDANSNTIAFQAGAVWGEVAVAVVMSRGMGAPARVTARSGTRLLSRMFTRNVARAEARVLPRVMPKTSPKVHVPRMSRKGTVLNPFGKNGPKPPKAYSVAYEMKLPRARTKGPRPQHFGEANSSLRQTMQNSPEFSRAMNKVIPGLDGFLADPLMASRSPTALGWTWHHHPTRKGVMQLVPHKQHVWGSLWQSLFHPGGRGGHANWGK